MDPVPIDRGGCYVNNATYLVGASSDSGSGMVKWAVTTPLR